MNFWDCFSELHGETGESLRDCQFLAKETSIQGFIVATDSAGSAIVLIESSGSHPPRIGFRYEGIEATFDSTVAIIEGGRRREATCSIVKCRMESDASKQFFLTSFQAIAEVVGPEPTPTEVQAAVDRISSIFSQIASAGRRSAIGLIGELFFIHNASDPHGAVGAWSIETTDRFDFVYPGIRADIKASSTRSRIHNVSFEQCNPPGETDGYFLSVFVEFVPNGMPCAELMESVIRACGGEPELELKVRDHVVSSLGEGLDDFLDSSFDVELAESSSRWFDARDVPAIRGELPEGVRDLRFGSDFSRSTPVGSNPM